MLVVLVVTFAMLSEMSVWAVCEVCLKCIVDIGWVGIHRVDHRDRWCRRHLQKLLAVLKWLILVALSEIVCLIDGEVCLKCMLISVSPAAGIEPIIVERRCQHHLQRMSGNRVVCWQLYKDWYHCKQRTPVLFLKIRWAKLLVLKSFRC